MALDFERSFLDLEDAVHRVLAFQRAVRRMHDVSVGKINPPHRLEMLDAEHSLILLHAVQLHDIGKFEVFEVAD